MILRECKADQEHGRPFVVTHFNGHRMTRCLLLATATLLHLLLLHSFGGKAGAQLSDLVIDICREPCDDGEIECLINLERYQKSLRSSPIFTVHIELCETYSNIPS
jgi:hypothetical protein